jgi:sulfatase modifying factor 1
MYRSFFGGFLMTLTILAGPVQSETLSSTPKGPGFVDRQLDGAPCPACPEMRVLPPGEFALGSPASQGHNNERGASNGPIPVSVSYALAVSTTEVSRGQFKAFMAANPNHQLQDRCAGMVDGQMKREPGMNWQNPGFEQKDDHPVVCVSWHDAKAFADWLSRLTGRPYRLLTEAEWEYAARGGTPYPYWWGTFMDRGVANCADEGCGDPFRHTARPSAVRANPFGLFHMLGNVWEWVEDCYDAKAYHAANPPYPRGVTGPSNCQKVIRGGGWGDNPWLLRAGTRQNWRPDMPLNDLGFRVASPDPSLPL